MELGNLKQTAHKKLVFFVFSCIIITTGLLFVMEKSEETAEHLNTLSNASSVLE